MPKITNTHYRKFLDQGEIELITPEELDKVITGIQGSKAREARALVILLYYSGARPNEVLRLKAKDIEREKQYLQIKMPSSKGGLPRTLNMPLKKKFITELYNYVKAMPPEMLLFYDFLSKRYRYRKKKNGDIVKYVVITDKLYYHFKKWFSGEINPYFLRHNRFSSLAMNDAADRDLKMWKGSKTFESIQPYTHMSSQKSKKIGRMLK